MKAFCQGYTKTYTRCLPVTKQKWTVNLKNSSGKVSGIIIREIKVQLKHNIPLNYQNISSLPSSNFDFIQVD